MSVFNKGDKVHLHDGTVQTIRRKGQLPRKSKGREHVPIRGFVRGELVDCLTGERQLGDWHENTITSFGHGMLVKNFVGIKQAATSGVTGSSAGNITDLGLARYWGVGYHSVTNEAASLLSTMTGVNSVEYAISSGVASSGRACLTGAYQCLSGVSALSQTYQYASTDLASGATVASVNAIMQHSTASVGAGTALSIALFSSSTKSTSQALNVTYNWVMGT